MNARFSLLLILLFLAGGAAFPQKRIRRTVPKTVSTTLIEPLSPAKKKPAPYQINLKIAEGPEYFVTIVSSFGPDDMSRKDIGAPDLKSFLSQVTNGSAAFSDEDVVAPNVVIDASPNITMRDLWTAISTFPRNRTNISIFMPAASIPSGRMLGGMSIDVPWESPRDRNFEVKPNPLLLIVTIDENDRLALNNDPVGTLSNPEPLSQYLRRIFREREVNGVFAEGSNAIEKTVSIVMPANGRKVAQLIAIVEAVKIPGAGPINLIMESPLNFTIDERKDLLSIPPGIPTKP